MSPQGITYRPDIDGLRALAVVSVVGYHAAPGIVRGGYVGVDIFFVISGYLITGLLLAEARAGTISLANFFARRIRRIFPALILVMAVTFCAGWFWLLPNEFKPLSRSMMSAALFVANFTFWREVGYFDTAAELKPLLHLWSLSVEEQFYLLWPILLMLMAGKPAWRSRLAWGLLTISFVLNATLVAKNGASTFFLLHSRLWELMAGAALAIRADARPAAQVRSDVAANGLAVLGLSSLLLTIALLDRNRHFPGGWALLPVVGTCCLISSGSQTWIARHLLSLQGAVALGLISYPLYLWHWPLLSFVRIIEGTSPATSSILVALGLALLLAAATYQWLEKPIRQSRRTRTAWVLISFMLVIAALGFAGVNGLIKPRLHGSIAEKFSDAALDWRYPGPTFRQENSSSGLMVQRVGHGRHNVLIWGDSNAEQYAPRMEKLVGAPDNRAAVTFATNGSCPPIRHAHIAANTGCDDFSERAFVLATSSEISTVVLVAQWTGYLRASTLVFTPEGGTPMNGQAAQTALMHELVAQIASLRSAGKRVVVVHNIPVAQEFDPHFMLKRNWRGDTIIQSDGLSRETWKAGLTYWTGDFAEVVRAAGAELIDPADFLCDARKCPAVDERGEPCYRDGFHLRASFVRDRVTYLDELVKPGK